jgi:hypothetical protein
MVEPSDGTDTPCGLQHPRLRSLAQFGNAAQHGRILMNSLLSELAPRLKVLDPNELGLLLEVS